MSDPRMLFLGSSSVFYHDFPQQVVELLRDDPRWRGLRWHWIGEPGTVIYKYLEPGYRVRHGLAEGEHVLDHIRQGKYDLVGLMVAVDRLGNPELTEVFTDAIRQFTDACAAAGSRAVFYEQSWCVEGIHNERYGYSKTGQRLLAELVTQSPHAVLAPCRSAWQLAWRDRPDLELNDLPDRVHPGLLGVYLNLATHLAAITDREPRMEDAVRHDPITALNERGGVNRLGMAAPTALDRDLAGFLRARAWEAWITTGRPVSGQKVQA